MIVIPHFSTVKSGEALAINRKVDLDKVKCYLLKSDGEIDKEIFSREQSTDNSFSIKQKGEETILLPPTLDNCEFGFMYRAYYEEDEVKNMNEEYFPKKVLAFLEKNSHPSQLWTSYFI